MQFYSVIKVVWRWFGWLYGTMAQVLGCGFMVIGSIVQVYATYIFFSNGDFAGAGPESWENHPLMTILPFATACVGFCLFKFGRWFRSVSN